MKYHVDKLRSDVMDRLGEISPAHVKPENGIPWPEDIIGLRAVSLLGETGAKLIRESPVDMLGGRSIEVGIDDISVRKMPCGLYGAEIRLPAGFLRMVSVKMSGWRSGISSMCSPGDSEWSRQWSAESGIAGSPESPRAYLDMDSGGQLLRLVGSRESTAVPEWLICRSVPVVDEEGEFDFPEALYAGLVGRISEILKS